MKRVTAGLMALVRFGQRAGPYLLLEILMPGGTLLALLLFLYRHRTPGWRLSTIRWPDVDFGVPRSTNG